MHRFFETAVRPLESRPHLGSHGPDLGSHGPDFPVDPRKAFVHMADQVVEALVCP